MAFDLVRNYLDSQIISCPVETFSASLKRKREGLARISSRHKKVLLGFGCGLVIIPFTSTCIRHLILYPSPQHEINHKYLSVVEKMPFTSFLSLAPSFHFTNVRSYLSERKYFSNAHSFRLRMTNLGTLMNGGVKLCDETNSSGQSF